MDLKYENFETKVYLFGTIPMLTLVGLKRFVFSLFGKQSEKGETQILMTSLLQFSTNTKKSMPWHGLFLFSTNTKRNYFFF